MNKIVFRKILYILILLFPVFLLSYFFLTSKFILLDDHEIYRLHFKEINIFTAVLDDWKYLYRFRPFYWLVRQLESLFFWINPLFWYGTSLAFFVTTITSLYLFFKNIGFKSFFSIIFVWSSVLGYQSIATWMALGIQEGLGLCLFSCSLYQLSLYGVYKIRKNFILSVLLFFLSFLVKETFFFLIPFIIVILLWQEERFTKIFLKKSLIFISGSIFMIPIIMIQSWRSHFGRMTVDYFNQVDVFKVNNMMEFLKLIMENYHIVLAFILFIVSGLILIISNKRDNNKIIFLFTFLLCFLGITAQFFIYSFTEYIAPHYIQPTSLIIILSLSFILKFYSLRSKFMYVSVLCLILPFTFFHTLEYANSHNFQSRELYEVEQAVIQTGEKKLVLVGHRSEEHEKLYSFYKRISYLSPDINFYFYHYDRNGHENDTRFDVAKDTNMTNINKNQLNDYALIVNISSNGFNEKNELNTIELSTKPIFKNIKHYSTWYVEAPSLVLKYQIDK